jgi:hypothetical protein
LILPEKMAIIITVSSMIRRLEMGSTKEKIKRMCWTGFFVCMTLAFVALFPCMAAAHAPSDIKASYDQATQTLTATITHTRPSDSHYVTKVEIKKNGAPFGVTEYKSQTGETVTYSYKIDAAAGDNVEVKAYCSKFGSKTQKFAVPDSSKPAGK